MSLPIIESCQSCGACCMEQESPPGYLAILIYGDDHAFSDEDLARFKAIPPEALAELNAYREHLRTFGEHPNAEICIWFDEQTKQCKHYDLRPDICRTGVVVGDEACRGWRERYEVT